MHFFLCLQQRFLFQFFVIFPNKLDSRPISSNHGPSVPRKTVIDAFGNW
jgi:hypothetical protein